MSDSLENKKTLHISDEKLALELEAILAPLGLEKWSADSDLPPDYVVTSGLDDGETWDSRTEVILIHDTHQTSQFLQSGAQSVFHPALLKHEIGQISFQRLLGANSSLALEVQFEDQGVSFRNFRLVDIESLGHYSDLVAKEIEKTEIHPVIPRIFFNSITTYLYELKNKKKISFPAEIDFGAFKDAFVIQIHCSMNDLTRGQILSSFGDYDSLNPMKGILSLVSAQVDALDIYSLESSSRLVITGVWFNRKFKKNKTLNPTVMIHDIPSFRVSNYEFKPGNLESAKSFKHENENEIIKRIEGLALEDVGKYLVPGDEKGEEFDHAQWIEGCPLTEEELTKIGGKFAEDESFIRIKNGEQVAPEEVWRIKKAAIVADLEEKLVLQGGLEGADDVKHVVRNHLGIKEELVGEILAISQGPTYEKTLPENAEDDDLWGVKDLSEQAHKQALLVRDAQIQKMKKLIDKMKIELNHVREHSSASAEGEERKNQHQKNTQEKMLEAKDRKIEALEKRNSDLLQEKQDVTLNDEDRSLMHELQKENEGLKSQLEMANQRMAQLNDNFNKRVKGQSEKLTKELEGYKKQSQHSHQIIQKFKEEKEQVQSDLDQARSQIHTLEAKVVELEKGLGGEESSKEELDKMAALLKEEQARARGLEAEVKSGQLHVRKHEQKLKFMQAQMEALQKEVAKGAQAKGKKAGANGDKATSAREQQLHRLIETMKGNEEKLNAELLSKKDELNKMKAENTGLSNKIAELEKKLQKYEKAAA